MPILTILLIILALLVAMALAAFQYFHNSKGNRLQKLVFTFLRFITLFSVLLLLVNPKITDVEYYIEKPNLVFAVDNSASIKYSENGNDTRQFLNMLSQDRDLKNRFDIQVFGFGNEVVKDPEITFEDSQSNIPELFKSLKGLYEGSRAPTVFISDGNQTMGEDFLYSAAKYPQPVYPVVAGDTSKFRDLAVIRINSNKYGFLNNHFPVEMLLSYSGEESVSTKLEIHKNGQDIYSEAVTFDKEKNAVIIRAELPASSVGLHTYRVILQAFQGEEDVVNNSKHFAIDIVDESTKILLLYEIMHPDLGALKKAIETNQQREVLLKKVGETNFNLEDFQLIILYQPAFESSTILKEVQEKNKNLWIITGPKTDWGILNAHQELVQQEITGQTEEYQPLYNSNFELFQNEDIGFSKFPPLNGTFGKLRANGEFGVLLYRKLQGIETKDPLWIISEGKDLKTAFLFGTGIWKWRSQIFREQNTFEPFDNFVGKVVQFLSSGKRKERLRVSYEPLYQSSDEIIITAEYYDGNYVFDPDAEIILFLTNESTNEVRQLPFLSRNSNYEVNPGSLAPGNYSFQVLVSGEDFKKTGKFNLSSFDVEKQFSRANSSALHSLAEDKGQDVFYLNDPQRLKEQLLKTKSYLPLQKSHEKTVPLIEWYYLLGIIIVSLGIEWFLRKYYGFI